MAAKAEAKEKKFAFNFLSKKYTVTTDNSNNIEYPQPCVERKQRPIFQNKKTFSSQKEANYA